MHEVKYSKTRYSCRFKKPPPFIYLASDTFCHFAGTGGGGGGGCMARLRGARTERVLKFGIFKDKSKGG